MAVELKNVLQTCHSYLSMESAPISNCVKIHEKALADACGVNDADGVYSVAQDYRLRALIRTEQYMYPYNLSDSFDDWRFEWMICATRVVNGAMFRGILHADYVQRSPVVRMATAVAESEMV